MEKERQKRRRLLRRLLPLLMVVSMLCGQIMMVSAENDVENGQASDVVINEVESNGDTTDWAEIYNKGEFPVDISGWYITDDDTTRLENNKTTPLAEGTILNPGEFFVFDQKVNFDFGLGAPDEVNLYDSANTLVEKYSWSTHANGVYARVPDGTGSLVEVPTSTKGAANDSNPVTPPAYDTVSWPGSEEVITYDEGKTMFKSDSSGLDFYQGRLYCINNKQGTFWVMDVAKDGTLDYADGFDANGKNLAFHKDAGNAAASNPDTEGITIASDGLAYAAAERDNNNKDVNNNVILQFDPWETPQTDGNVVVAKQDWDITSLLPDVAANAGIEAVEWVSDTEVDGKLFDQNTGEAFNHTNYPNAIESGVFFVALEDNGHVYALVLNKDGSSELIADIDAGMGHAMSLDYDNYTGILWAGADDGCQNTSAQIVLNGTTEPKVTLTAAPAGMDVSRNNEGFAIAEPEYTVDGLRPVYHFMDGANTGVLTISYLTTDYTVQVEDLTGKTIILHSNDVHGAVAGYANIAGVKNEFEEKGANVILADAGDYSQGTPYVSATKGADAISMMNAAGYDVATLGNHEFDYGYEQLVQNMNQADFEVLCADVLDKSGNTIYDGHTIIEKDGVKIGFFGLVTPEAQTKANPALIQGLTFLKEKDLYAASQNQVNELKQEGADLIICLSHLGVDDESKPNRSYELLENTSGIDMVIDGHSHTVMTEGENGEKIQSTGTAFENIGVIVIDQDTKSIEDNYLIPVNEDTASDAEVAEAAQKIVDRVTAEYGETFARTETDLNGDRAPQGNRDSETNLGDLITDAMLWSVSKDVDYLDVPAENIVAVTNGGGIRAWIYKGDITKKDVNTVLPFGNTIAVVYVKGEELLEALEASTYCTPTAVGGFPQIAGMEINIDTEKEYDANPETYPGSTYYGPASINRVTIKSVNGRVFDPTATYAVVTNDFCAAGGDTYYAFASASGQFDTGIPMDEAVMDYITTELNGIVTSEQYGEPQRRITLAATCAHANTKTEGAVEATCDASGFTGKVVCIDCGAVLKNSEVIEPLGHNYGSDGICIRCGEKKAVGGTDAGNKDKGSTPKTGDDSDIMLYMILCTAGLGVIGYTTRKKFTAM